MTDRDPTDPPLTPADRWTVGFFLLVLFGLFVAEAVTNYHPAKLAGLLIVAFWVPLLTLQELGHAAAAWLLGWRVRRFVLGIGKLLAFWHLGRTPVELRLVLTTGYVVPQPKRIRLPQLELALIYLAGPGVVLLLVALIVVLVGLGPLLTLTEHTGMVALQSLCLAALAGVILNLAPHSIPRPGGEALPSAGLGFLRAFFLPTKHFERMIDDRDDEIRPEE
jgi:hypothetical protein